MQQLSSPFESTYQGVARLACFGLAHIEAKFEVHNMELVVCTVKTLELPQVRRARTWDVPDALTAVFRVEGPRQGFSRSTCSKEGSQHPTKQKSEDIFAM